MSTIAKKKTVDMTEGSPLGHIVRFVIPMILGMLFQQLYNIVDAIVVGRWLGVEALAGIGSTGSINFMVIGFCMGIGSGFALPVANSFGAKDYKTMRRYVGNGICLSLMFSVIITVAVAIFCKDILLLMGTPEDIFSYAYQYIFVIFLGIPVLYAYNYLAALLRSLGDSKSPVYFLVISTALNVVLDIFAVMVLKMGVLGPAIATVVAQGVSVVLCYVYILRRFDLLRLTGSDLRPDRRMMGRLVSFGLPMGFQYSITAIGSLIMTAATNALGSACVASHAAAVKVTGVLSCPFDALGGTMANYAGQNAGAGKIKRIKSGAGYAMLMGGIYALLVFALFWLFGDVFTMAFVEGSETEIIANSHLYLVMVSAFYILLCAVNVFRFALQGMGYSSLAMTAGVMEMVGRSLVGIWLVPRIGFPATGLASPVAWILAVAFLVPAFFVCCRCLERKRIFAGEPVA